MCLLSRSSRSTLRGCLFCLTVCWCSGQGFTARAEDPNLLEIFTHPPKSARPWVFWYWMNGCVSAEGITADLEAMQRIGIGGAYLMPIRGPSERSACEHPIAQMTPEWWELLRHTMREARRLDLELGMHACDGFAVAGGPWIDPQHSMQKVVWSTTRVNAASAVPLRLPQPETNEDYYRDIAVLAFPSLVSAEQADTQPLAITTSLPDFDASFLSTGEPGKRVRREDPGWIEFRYSLPFTCRSITITPDGNNYQAHRLLLEVSDDGKNYRRVCRLTPPRHGWQNGDGTVTHSIVPTTATHFRFQFDKEGSEPGSEELDSAKWSPVLKVQRIELACEPRIHQYRGKSGAVWRISERTTNDQIPQELCIRREELVDLTDKLGADGTLDWKAPPGEWTILRMGHTSTGMRNETGGAAQGLECDKLNRAAVELQFVKWFGEIRRQVGPELANEVLRVFHVDSWECGSQNWTAGFREYHKTKHGCDPVLHLPAMAGYPVESVDASENFLRDVRETISELLTQNFFHTLRELSHNCGCQFSAECVAPTMLCDGMQHFREVDIPMGEFWLNSPTHDKPNDILDAVSAAHVYGKPVVQAEAFTELRMNWREKPSELKSLGDLHLCLGVNRLVFHVFTHNPCLDRRPGMTLDNIGLFFQRDQTWWEPARAWIDYLSRCQALLQVGDPVVDIAVYTGDELPRRSLLPEKLVPLLPGLLGDKVVARETKRLANEGVPITESPPGVRHGANINTPGDWVDALHGYHYDSLNYDALSQHTRVKSGKLCLEGGSCYSLLVCPPEEARMSKQLRGIVSRANSRFPVAEKFAAANLASLGLPRDFSAKEITGEAADGIAWTHRRTKSADVYFVSNQLQKSRTLCASFRVTGRLPETWDPVTGECNSCQLWKAGEALTQLELELPPIGSLFVIFQTVSATREKAKASVPNSLKVVGQLNGPWIVRFEPGRGAPIQAQRFDSLQDWTTQADPTIRFYSGTAIYEKTFSWNRVPLSGEKVWLDLGEVKDLGVVQLNGKECGIAWTPPYRVEIRAALRQGENKLEIAVTNTWHNRLLGEALKPAAQRTTWTTASLPPKDSALEPSGLLGPVTLTTQPEANQR